MGFDDGFRDSEAEAGAAGGEAAGLVGAVEAVEDAGEGLGFHAFSGIGDAEDSVVFILPQGDGDGTGVAIVVDGVGEEIRDDEREVVGVAFQGEGGEVAVEGDAASPAPVPGQAAALPASGAKPAGGLDKELEAKKKQAKEAEAAKRKADEERIAKAQIENCARAKQAKTTFESGVRIGRTNAAGEKEFMDDAARAAELKRIQGIIDRDCK